MINEMRVRYSPPQTIYKTTFLSDLRTSLFAYLVTKSNNGKLILRMDDTNCTQKYIHNILSIAGLTYDEGPGADCNYGPYFQSQRKNIYMGYAKKLIDLGEAYYCFCGNKAYDTPGKYDRRCFKLDKEEIEKKLSKNEPFAIRYKVPDVLNVNFTDEVYGNITVDRNQLNDQVLIKSNGDPTYLLSSVVDDYLMKITHVVREHDYINNTPKEILLYKSLGWIHPKYIHVANKFKDPYAGNLVLIRKVGRIYDPFYEELIEDGFLKEAIINYIALLGWNPGNKQELFCLEELEKVFTIDKIRKTMVYYDIDKLKWYNKKYIERISFEDFHDLAKPYYEDNITNKTIDLKKLSEMLKGTIDTLDSIPSSIKFLNDLPQYDKLHLIMKN